MIKLCMGWTEGKSSPPHTTPGALKLRGKRVCHSTYIRVPSFGADLNVAPLSWRTDSHSAPQLGTAAPARWNSHVHVHMMNKDVGGALSVWMSIVIEAWNCLVCSDFLFPVVNPFFSFLPPLTRLLSKTVWRKCNALSFLVGYLSLLNAWKRKRGPETCWSAVGGRALFLQSCWCACLARDGGTRLASVHILERWELLPCPVFCLPVIILWEAS